jgi:hypothetical protein
MKWITIKNCPVALIRDNSSQLLSNMFKMKKKILFLSFALLLVLIAIKGFDFFYKRDISFRLVCELPDVLPPDWGFLPASYKFIHTEKDFDLIPESSEVSKVLKKMNFDFK